MIVAWMFFVWKLKFVDYFLGTFFEPFRQTQFRAILLLTLLFFYPSPTFLPDRTCGSIPCLFNRFILACLLSWPSLQGTFQECSSVRLDFEDCSWNVLQRRSRSNMIVAGKCSSATLKFKVQEGAFSEYSSSNSSSVQAQRTFPAAGVDFFY